MIKFFTALHGRFCNANSLDCVSVSSVLKYMAGGTLNEGTELFHSFQPRHSSFPRANYLIAYYRSPTITLGSENLRADVKSQFPKSPFPLSVARKQGVLFCQALLTSRKGNMSVAKPIYKHPCTL